MLIMTVLVIMLHRKLKHQKICKTFDEYGLFTLNRKTIVTLFVKAIKRFIQCPLNSCKFAHDITLQRIEQKRIETLYQLHILKYIVMALFNFMEIIKYH